MNIIIAGHGAYGSALGQVLTENGHLVSYYDPYFDDSVPATAFQTTDVVVIAVPSAHLAAFTPTLATHYNNQPVILATKGVLNLSSFSDKFSNLAALSGPGFAADIMAHVPTFLTATSNTTKLLFSTDYLNIEVTEDIHGVLACGAIKNIYAIGAGLRHLQPETPEFDTYIEQVLAELKSLLPEFGGKPETADLSCGIGDLILTCGSTKSRNYSFGLKLSQDPHAQPDQTTEGLEALYALPDRIVLPPILQSIQAAIMQSGQEITSQSI